MKKLGTILLAGFLGVLLCFDLATADPFPDLSLPGIGSDLDDSGYFYPENEVVNIELYDLAELHPNLTGSSFGFFFQDDPSRTLIELFDQNDLLTSGAAPSSAVDFQNGFVWDLDANELQGNFFTPTDNNIGFYLQYETDTTITLFSDPLLNPENRDYAATYPVLDAPDSFLLAFWLPGATQGESTPLYIEATTGLTPVSVPEPTMLLLAGSFVFGMLGIHRKRKRR